MEHSLAELAARLGAAPPEPPSDAVVTGVTHDSRAVQVGDVYAALPGARTHGARFATVARNGGAVACLTDADGADEAAAAGLATYVVEDPRRVLGPLAAWIYGEPARALTTIGVTGTNGKTTTAYLLEAGLRAAGRATGLIGTIETRIGDEAVPSVRTTPESTDLQALFAVMLERGVDAVAMEVSSHALALGRVDGTTFDVAVFTNLSQDHLDFHPDLESYFQAKASLFTPEHARVAVLDIDDAHGARLAGLATEAGLQVVTVSPGGNPKAGWRVEDVVGAATGSTFTLRGPGPGAVAVRAGTRLLGVFNVDNAALAVVALVAVGVEPAVAAAGVAACPGVPGRMERVETGAKFLALVDYAHSPDSLELLLGTARGLLEPGGRLIVVVGAGGDRDPYKRSMMGAIAVRGADVVVLTSDNPRSEDPLAILAALRAGADGVPGGAVEVEPDRRAAIELAVRTARPGDVVVVAGKGHEQGQEIAGVIHPFDDRVVLRETIMSGAT